MDIDFKEIAKAFLGALYFGPITLVFGLVAQIKLEKIGMDYWGFLGFVLVHLILTLVLYVSERYA